MTEPTRTPTTGRPARPATTASAAWKSGLLASGFGAVLLGWALLVRAEAPTNPATLAQAQSNVVIAQAPATAQSNQLGRQTSGAPIAVPSLPQAPVFQRPVTRTRGS